LFEGLEVERGFLKTAISMSDRNSFAFYSHSLGWLLQQQMCSAHNGVL